MKLTTKEIALLFIAIIGMMAFLVGAILANYLLIPFAIPAIAAGYKALESITYRKELDAYWESKEDKIGKIYNATQDAYKQELKEYNQKLSDNKELKVDKLDDPKGLQDIFYEKLIEDGSFKKKNIEISKKTAQKILLKIINGHYSIDNTNHSSYHQKGGEVQGRGL